MKKMRKFVALLVAAVCVVGTIAGCGSAKGKDGEYAYYEEGTVEYGDTTYSSYEYVNLIIEGDNYTIQCLSSTGTSLGGGSFAGRWMKGTCTVDGDIVTCEVPTSVGSMDVELNDAGDALVVAATPNEQEIDVTEFRLPAGSWYQEDFSSKWTVNTDNNTCTPVK